MYGVTFNQETNSLYLDKHDCGLLSNASVTMKSLLTLHETISKPIKVFWPYSSIWNKSDRIERNVYELYFKTLSVANVVVKPDVYFNAMIGDCGRFNFSDLETIRDTYFYFSDDVQNRRRAFIEKYNINFERTIAILYRGTDKILEVPKIDPKYYVSCLSGIKDIASYKILLQTDQQQILEYFEKQFKNQLVHIEEMPITKTMQVIHNLSETEKGLSNYELGMNYLAAISILSKCKYVVFDTNNAGLWVCILRGSLQNTCQVHADIHIFNRFEG
ncbi:MAG: hypothetical protein Q7R33_09615 [Nitrosarchaeum sp.]|nr:hypothetical protein [Nitrosarchaeum sp.]